MTEALVEPTSVTIAPGFRMPRDLGWRRRPKRRPAPRRRRDRHPSTASAGETEVAVPEAEFLGPLQRRRALRVEITTSLAQAEFA